MVAGEAWRQLLSVVLLKGDLIGAHSMQHDPRLFWTNESSKETSSIEKYLEQVE